MMAATIRRIVGVNVGVIFMKKERKVYRTAMVKKQYRLRREEAAKKLGLCYVCMKREKAEGINKLRSLKEIVLARKVFLG